MSITVEDAKVWIEKQLSDKKWMEQSDRASKSCLYCGAPISDSRRTVYNNKVSVSAEGTCDAARRLIGLRRTGVIPANSRILIHNFADQKLVGGYFNKRSSSAQEENICSNTALYGVLLTCANKYDGLYQNVMDANTLHLNKQFVPMLLHKDVPISMVPGFTEDFDTVDVLTAAAYNIRNRNNKPAGYDNLLKQQITSLLRFVEESYADEPVYFITGAWGCGVFRNEPSAVFGNMKEYVMAHSKDGGRIHLYVAVPGGSNLYVAQSILGV